MQKSRRQFLYLLLALSLFVLTTYLGHGTIPAHLQIQEREKLSLEQRVDLSWQIAAKRLRKTIVYLEEGSFSHSTYPEYTEKGQWNKARVNSWAAGFFPGLLWKMSRYSGERESKAYWVEKAQQWGEATRERIGITKDVTANNLFIFAPWFEESQGEERAQQLQSILEGARYLSTSFHPDIGTLGVVRKAKTDKQEHWQSFIDHIINVEQLLWAANHNPDTEEARKWQSIALSHLKTLGNTFGKNRHPGDAGTWQRGYFEQRKDSPNYRKFLFNEGKQGWRDSSTWSRGQAWVIYGATIGYYYTRDAEVLRVAKDSINYFLSQLPADGIAPWDFDYAHQHPQTEKDSSATAIALSGMLKLFKALPKDDGDRARYAEAGKTMLRALTGWEYLKGLDSPEMSILQRGCYHHPASLSPSTVKDNGLIWGDYFFLDALGEYREVF
jgi:hypothetical protein